MDICKMLTISTAHIKQETAESLDRQSASDDLRGYPVVYQKDCDGWWICTADAHDNIDFDLLPSDLVDCICLAVDNGCEWLCLDRDGLIEVTLPTYDWNE